MLSRDRHLPTHQLSAPVDQSLICPSRADIQSGKVFFGPTRPRLCSGHLNHLKKLVFHIQSLALAGLEIII